MRLVLTACCVPICGLLFASTPALAARGHIFSQSFGEKGSGNGQFNEPARVAVNETSGDVYVVDKSNDRVEYFSSSGAYLAQFNGSAAPTGAFSSPEGVAVDNSCVGGALECPDPSVSDVYVVDTGHHAIDKFSATGAYLGQITEAASVAFGSVGSAVVDARGDLWICEAAGPNHVRVDTFSNGQTNELLDSKEAIVPGSSSSPLCAVDSSDDLYISDGGPVSKFNSLGQILVLKMDEEPVSGIAIEFATNDVYIDEVSHVSRFAPEGAAIERLDVPGMHGSCVAVNSASGTLYVADSSTDVVDVYALESPLKEEEATKKHEEEVAKRHEEEAQKKWLEEVGRRVAEEAVANRKHEEETTAEKHLEEEAAVNRKHEEEAAAAKKQAEEAAEAMKATSSVSFDGSTIAVRSGDEAVIKLTCAGTATCAGKLTLTVRRLTGKGKQKHTRVVTIGTVAFSIPVGKTGAVELELNASGRALLRAGHGRLAAHLGVLKSSPAPPSQARAENVKLVPQQAPGAER